VINIFDVFIFVLQNILLKSELCRFGWTMKFVLTLLKPRVRGKWQFVTNLPTLFYSRTTR